MDKKQKCGTILLVDDEELVRLIAGEMLKHLGFNTINADCGADGLALFSEKKSTIDLIIVDLVMPKMSGIEFYKNTRELDANIPIIISSGITELSQKEDVMHIGVAGFLEKPFTIESLKQTINPILSKKNGRLH